MNSGAGGRRQERHVVLRGSFLSVWTSLIVMSVPEIAVILVDNEGTAYLVVALPSSFYSNGKSHNEAGPIIPRICTPVDGSKCGLNNEEIHDQVDHRTTCKRQKVVYSHEEDEAVVESAILARKGQLEKDAEQRAEIVFKQWCKEKKTLEQAIDETLRFGAIR